MVPYQSGSAFTFYSCWRLRLADLALYQRVFRLVLQGRAEARFDRPMERLTGAMAIVLGQKKVLQRVPFGDWAGLGHASIFWGFLTFMLSYAIFIFGAVAWTHFPEWLLTETGARVYSSYLDILAGVLLVVLVWAAARRWVVRPRRLSYDLTRNPDAIIIVGMIAGLMASTILTHSFYVAEGGTGPEADVIIGGALGGLFVDWGISESAASALQGLFWWIHFAIILFFTVYIPFSKHMHMVAAPINAFFRTLDSRGALPAMDLENAERFGASRVQDFTWKQLLDGYACAVCGRCSDVCPANVTGKLLSPMHIVENLKDHMIEIGHQGERNAEHVEPSPILNNAIPETAIWDCLNCGACMEECPVTVEHVPTIMDMRRYMVLEESNAPETAMNALISLEQRGHPWRGTQFSRTDWAEGLDVPTLAENPDAEILFWVGCTPALEQRSQAIARSMVKVLKSANVNFAILGDEETCTGDPARRMGNEYLFQIMATQNIETLNSYNVKKVVTICPHCFNTMKNEYPQLGGEFEVLHYSQFVDGLIKDGRIKTGKDDGCHRRLPRLVLPRSAQRRIRRAPQRGEGDPGAQTGGDGRPLPPARVLLRRRRRAHVDRGEPGAASEPRPHRAFPGDRGADRWRFLPVLPSDDDRGHTGQGAAGRKGVQGRSGTIVGEP